MERGRTKRPLMKVRYGGKDSRKRKHTHQHLQTGPMNHAETKFTTQYAEVENVDIKKQHKIYSSMLIFFIIATVLKFYMSSSGWGILPAVIGIAGMLYLDTYNNPKCKQKFLIEDFMQSTNHTEFYTKKITAVKVIVGIMAVLEGVILVFL